MSDSVQPQRQQPTRLPRPYDSPGKNTGVGCHFLLQCMKVKSESEVTQSCPTPSHPMDCSPPGSSIHGICQARVLEWVAIDLAQNSLELKLPSRSSLPFYAKQRTLSPKGKKKILSLITPSSQLVQPLVDLQNSLPQPFAAGLPSMGSHSRTRLK